MSIQEGTRDPQAGTSDAPPGREMQVRQGAQDSASEEGRVHAGWPRRWKEVFGEEVLLEIWRPLGRWTLGEG